MCNPLSPAQVRAGAVYAPVPRPLCEHCTAPNARKYVGGGKTVWLCEACWEAAVWEAETPEDEPKPATAAAAVPPADVPCWWCGQRPGDLVSLRGEDMVICDLCLEARADDGGDRWLPSLDAALARERRIDGQLDAERSAVAEVEW